MSQKNLERQFHQTIFRICIGEAQDKIDKHRDFIISQSKPNAEIMFERKENNNLYIREQMLINAKRYTNAFNIIRKLPDNDSLQYNIDYIYDLYGLQFTPQIFLSTIELLGNPQQVSYWKEMVANGRVTGCYAQTELGHGSNVQALQTIATYDEKTDSFYVTSPNNTSNKFWPGMLGLFATHGILHARTFVKGKSIGVQAFVIQIRDNNLQCLPGRQAGNIGPKLGFNRVDNGYLKLTNIKIPRTALLMRFIKVQKDGSVTGLQNKAVIKYAYGSMLNLRVKLVFGFALAYILVPCIFTWQQANILKINSDQYKKFFVQSICSGYGIVLANNASLQLYIKYLAALKREDFNQADELLVDCHILSSTMKAITSMKCIDISSKCIQKNNLASFLYSGTFFPFGEAIPTATYEGDNQVLLQQTARYVLMKQVQDDDSQLKKPCDKVCSSDLQGVLSVFQYAAKIQTRQLKLLFEKQNEKGTPLKTFWNEIYQRQIIDVALVWGAKEIVKSMINCVQSIDDNKEFYLRIARVYASVLLKQCPSIGFCGIQVIEGDDWNQFNSQEFETIFQIGHPLIRREQYNIKYSPFKFLERNQQWMRPRL